MQKKLKMNFFNKGFLSISDFRFYPYIIKNEKLTASFGYFLTLILLISLFVTFSFSNSLFVAINNFMKDYNEIVPDFSLSDGVLTIEKQENIVTEDNVFYAIATNYSLSEYKNTTDYRDSSKYDSRIFINSDSITFDSFNSKEIVFPWKELSVNFTKASLYEYLTDLLGQVSFKLLVICFIFIGIFIAFIFAKLIEILFYAVFASLISIFYKVRVEFKNYMKIAIYIVTLPYLIELISILLVGSVKNYTTLVSSILAYVYIFYAIRAVRLDAFLLIINSNNNDSGSNERSSVDKESSIGNSSDSNSDDIDSNENKSRDSDNESNNNANDNDKNGG